MLTRMPAFGFTEDALGRERGADCRESGPCARFGDSQNALIAQGSALLGNRRKTMVLACLSWAFAVIVAHLLSWKTVQIAR